MERLSNDPAEARWDHWREETLFHVYHALLHKVYGANLPRDAPPLIPRVHELFFYAHQQLLMRGELEREFAGLPEIVPLDPATIRQNLGPGYRAGW